MHVEQVEIFSDKTNRAVMRHPERQFPGVLVQGDSLRVMCVRADEVCSKAKSTLDAETYEHLNKLRNQLQSYLTHYKMVLQEHGVPLPFDDLAGRYP